HNTIFEIPGEHASELGPQFSRAFRQRVMRGAEEFRKLLLRPGKDILSKQSAAGTEFQNLYFRGRADGPPYFLELARQETSKDSMHVAGGIKVSRLPELLGVA